MQDELYKALTEFDVHTLRDVRVFRAGLRSTWTPRGIAYAGMLSDQGREHPFVMGFAPDWRERAYLGQGCDGLIYRCQETLPLRALWTPEGFSFVELSALSPFASHSFFDRIEYKHLLFAPSGAGLDGAVHLVESAQLQEGTPTQYGWVARQLGYFLDRQS